MGSHASSAGVQAAARLGGATVAATRDAGGAEVQMGALVSLIDLPCNVGGDVGVARHL